MIYEAYKLDHKYNFDEVISPIIKSHNTDNNNFKKTIVSNDEIINIYIYERYFLRIDSNLSITIISTTRSNSTVVEFISAGGSQGILSIYNGAESSSIKEVTKILINDGFGKIK